MVECCGAASQDWPFIHRAPNTCPYDLTGARIGATAHDRDIPEARKPALSADKLNDLEAETLAQLVLQDAARNVGFRRQVKAGLAGKSGP